MMNKVIDFAVKYIHKNTLNKEGALGYKVKLNADPNYWLTSYVAYPMDRIWKKNGLQAIGNNYFTIGALENELSTRFIYNSPLFQSWLGCYIVRFNTSRAWTIEDHFKLAEADQLNWLEFYGDPNPEVNISKHETKDLGSFTLQNFTGNIYEGIIKSNIDIGNKIPSTKTKIIVKALAKLFNISTNNSKCDYKQLYTVLDTTSPLNSFQNITLHGYIAIINLDDTTKAVLYANASKFNDKDNGNSIDHFSVISNVLRDSLEKITITAV